MTFSEYNDIRSNEMASSDVTEIYAFSANNAGDLKKKLTGILEDCKDATNGQTLRLLAAQSRNEFNPLSFSRLAMAVPPGGVLTDYLNGGISLLDAGKEINMMVLPGIFYGEGELSGKTAFLFPGQGSQYVSMGKDLLDSFPEVTSVIDDMNRLFKGNPSLNALIYPEISDDKADKERKEGLLRQTNAAQPAIGAISLAMIKILSGFNISPEVSAGHSYGELTALCAGKRISEKDFLRLSIWRGRLMAAAAAGEDKGQMLAVKADLERIDQLLRNSGVDVVLANRNGPEQGVLSGSSHEIEKMAKICKEQRIRAMLLPVSAAFHSRLVSDAAEGFREKIEMVDILPASIPVYSNKTAMPYPVEEAGVRRLFGEHLISPVNFMDQIQTMYSDGVRLFIEVGPKNALTGLVNSILKGHPILSFSVDGSSGKQSGLNDLAIALCRLAAVGYPVDLRPWEKP